MFPSEQSSTSQMFVSSRSVFWFSVVAGHSVYMCAYFTQRAIVLIRSPLVSSCWCVYVMPTEPTTVRSDLNTYCKLVFSLTSAMTFTSTPPWRLVWISCLSSCIPCACVVVGFIYLCVCIFFLNTYEEVSRYSPELAPLKPSAFAEQCVRQGFPESLRKKRL